MGVRKQSSREHTLRDKAHTRVWADGFFKPDLITDGLSDRLAEFPCDSSRCQSRGDPARFKHNHLAAHDSHKRRRHSGGLSRARSSYDYKVRVLS